MNKGFTYKCKIKDHYKELYENSLVNEKRDTGVIGAIVGDHGYGFIKCIGGDNRLFFHISEIMTNSPLRQGDEVEFTVMEDYFSRSQDKWHATRIRALPKGTVKFHTIYDDVYTGILYVENDKQDSVSDEIDFEGGPAANANGGNSIIPTNMTRSVSLNQTMYVIYKDYEKQGFLDLPKTENHEYKIPVTSINSLIPEVRIWLEKNRKLSLSDLNEVEVNFQIQKSKKSNASTATNINPVEWICSMSTAAANAFIENMDDGHGLENGLDASIRSVTGNEPIAIKHKNSNKNFEDVTSRIKSSSSVSNNALVNSLNQNMVEPTSPNSTRSSCRIKSIMEKVSVGGVTPLKTIKSQSSVPHLKHSGFIVTLKDNYGFIEAEDHEHEVFFHYSELIDIDWNLQEKNYIKEQKILAAAGMLSETGLNNLSQNNVSKPSILQKCGFRIGTEVSYTLADKDGKLCAKQLIKLAQGSLIRHETVSDILYTGVIDRSTKSIDQTQKLYYGQIKVQGIADSDQQQQFYENSPKKCEREKYDSVSFGYSGSRGVETILKVR